jgi:uncharacterized caspase-like protein
MQLAPRNRRLGFVLAGLALLATPAAAERRVALVIGNSAYQHTSPLPNPRHDAEDIATALRRLEFEVFVGQDLNKREMERLVREFTGKLAGVDVALLFYAGYALQVGSQNFLMPIDARLVAEADVDFETMPLTLVLRHMQLDAKTNLVFLDACRDNPLANTLARRAPSRSSYFGQGLAQVESGIGTLIGFSTQPNRVASDGSGRNSPYAGALLTAMEMPDIDIAVVMRHVRNQVLQATGQRQVPWEHSSLTEQFIFRRVSTQPPGTAAPKQAPPAVRASPAEDATAWAAIKETTSIAMLEAFLKRFPTGIYADFAQARLQELKQRSTATLDRPLQPPPNRGDITSRIASWVQQEYLEDRVTYAPTVDWYDKGMISRDAVLQDRAKYLANWPQRRFTLVPGSLQVAAAGPGRYTATFNLTWWVRNARGEKRSGRSHLVVDLVASGDQLAVARQKEVVDRQR